ncbi:MAG TPA: AMP-binding protein [Thermoanaerobaculia bacterium]
MIDWRSSESHLLLNPRMPEEERRRLESFVTPLESHVWLATSGTSGALKLTALSKRALLVSAAAVNRHLESTARDVWYCVLPTFHVGGVSIHARAFLSGARVVELPWDPHAFAASRELTLASLVPAQVSDLVRERLDPPPSLRAIVVGGGALGDDLYGAARAAGWPLLPSYGMTECCSQVATATLASPELILLDHVDARIEADGRIALQSESLLTGYGTEHGFIDAKQNGWFITEDLGIVRGRVLHVAGRRGEFVKIGGESVDLARLDRIVSSVAGDRAAIVAMPDPRLGHVIHLVVERGADTAIIAAAYDARVHPFERARRVHLVSRIPRTALGKLKRVELAASLPTSVE